MSFLSNLFGKKTSAEVNDSPSLQPKKIYIVIGTTKPISSDNASKLLKMGRDELTKTNKEFKNRMHEYKKLKADTIAKSYNIVGNINSDNVALYDQCVKQLIKDQTLHNFAMNFNHFYIVARNPSLNLKWIAIYHFE